MRRQPPRGSPRSRRPSPRRRRSRGCLRDLSRGEPAKDRPVGGSRSLVSRLFSLGLVLILVAPAAALQPPGPPRPRSAGASAPAEPQRAEGGPATPKAAAIMEILDRVRETMTDTRYQHRTRVRESEGIYNWDCSGMTDWVLSRASRRAHAALRRERPVARTFFRTIERAPTEGHRRGWQEVARVQDVRPGDIFAWTYSRDSGLPYTGHVGFITGTPRRASHVRNGWIVDIVDSSLGPRAESEDGGFGENTFLFIVSPEDPTHVLGYTSRIDSTRYYPTRVRSAASTEHELGPHPPIDALGIGRTRSAGASLSPNTKSPARGGAFRLDSDLLRRRRRRRRGGLGPSRCRAGARRTPRLRGSSRRP